MITVLYPAGRAHRALVTGVSQVGLISPNEPVPGSSPESLEARRATVGFVRFVRVHPILANPEG